MLDTPEWTARLKPRSPHALSKVRQLYLALYDCISNGQIPNGSLLPASRALAAQLGVGRNTVIAAYNQLKDEQLVEGTGRSGTRVLFCPPQQLKLKQRGADQTPVGTRSALAKRTGSAHTSGNTFNVLAPGMPDPQLFPNQEWRRALAKAGRLNESRLGYVDRPLPELQNAIARHLAIYRSYSVNPQRIIITSGTRQSLNLAASLYTQGAQQAWVESPGYRGAVDAFKLFGLDLSAMPISTEGCALPSQPEAMNPAMIYLTPCFQYPTGVALSVKSRQEILRFAASRHSVIFEDDYDSEFRNDSQARPAMAAEAEQMVQRGEFNPKTMTNPVILHAGTFSKLLFPAARVAWLVVPEEHIDTAHITLRALGGGHNTVAQATVAELLDNGSISRHLTRARAVYQQRRHALIDALNNSTAFKSSDYSGGSLSLVVPLRRAANRAQLMKNIHSAELGVRDLDDFLWDRPPRRKIHALVLGVGNVTSIDVAKTVKKLTHCITQAM